MFNKKEIFLYDDPTLLLVLLHNFFYVDGYLEVQACNFKGETRQDKTKSA